MNKLSTKIISILFFLCLSVLPSYGQYYYYNDRFYDNDIIWETGLSFGAMHAVTDVGRKRFTLLLPANLDWKNTRMNAGVYGGVLYKNVIGVRMEATLGKVSAADSNGMYPERNLSFRSNIRELSLVTEFHPLMLRLYNGAPSFSPYLLAGVGLFSFNPKAKYNGQWVDLHPLRTEGQAFAEYPDRKQYKLTQFCLPVGVGVKMELSPFITARLEALFRFTATDYLDDACQTFIDANYFKNYLAPENAAMAEALANRYKEKNPSANFTGSFPRGGTETRDKYLTINVKVGYAIGRERIQ